MTREQAAVIDGLAQSASFHKPAPVVEPEPAWQSALVVGLWPIVALGFVAVAMLVLSWI